MPFFFLFERQRWNNSDWTICCIWHALKLSMQQRNDMDLAGVFWHHNSALAACSSVCSFFFSFFFSLLSESTVLDGRFCRWQGTPWHGDSPYATCTLLNAKESKGCETYSFWFKFQREVFVCVRACVFEMFPCVCVCKLKRYAWNRVEDNCPFPLRSYSLILLKPATEMWLFAFWDNIYTICVFSHMYLLATYCVSAYR